MPRINKFQLCVSLVGAGIVASSSVSAFAAQSSGRTTASTEDTTSTSAMTDSSTEPIDSSTASDTSEVSSTAELHQRGDGLLAGLKKSHGNMTMTTAQHTKVCEIHKNSLTSKFTHIVSNSQKDQTRIDAIYAKGLAYQQSSNSQPTGFNALVATANSAKANSSASIAALQAITPTIDCSSMTVTSDVATFKAAAQQTRDNLKAYRTAVKAVLQALETTKPSAKGSTN